MAGGLVLKKKKKSEGHSEQMVRGGTSLPISEQPGKTSQAPVSPGRQEEVGQQAKEGCMPCTVRSEGELMIEKNRKGRDN